MGFKEINDRSIYADFVAFVDILESWELFIYLFKKPKSWWNLKGCKIVGDIK